ncbi:hypothetical protein M0R45_014795 [Rubus argutus]|uniref:Protein yippee-like n=1 Tax=Rubus argutus TaxID=59490 RepID=A0AAW1XPD7_RUBAR
MMKKKTYGVICSTVQILIDTDFTQWSFGSRVNITIGALEERMMLSGLHTVADTFCCCCGQIVGWKYETAHENTQKYKEGKFVLERGRLVEEVDFSTEFDVDSDDA